MVFETANSTRKRSEGVCNLAKAIFNHRYQGENLGNCRNFKKAELSRLHNSLKVCFNNTFHVIDSMRGKFLNL